MLGEGIIGSKAWGKEKENQSFNNCSRNWLHSLKEVNLDVPNAISLRSKCLLILPGLEDAFIQENET